MIEEVTPEQLETMLGGDDSSLRIVDIRSPDAFADGHVPDSENVPMSELPARAAAVTDADVVVTVCPHGEASRQAARLLSAHRGATETEIYSLKGGLAAWSNERDLAASEDGHRIDSDPPF